MESHIKGYPFDIVTTNGQLITVSIPEVILPHNLILMSLNSFQKRELLREEKEPYLPDIERAHFSENSPIDESVITREEGMKVSQTVYVRGILTKNEGHYYIHSGGITTLTVSARSITEESVSVVELVYRIGTATNKGDNAGSCRYWITDWWILSSSIEMFVKQMYE